MSDATHGTFKVKAAETVKTEVGKYGLNVIKAQFEKDGKVAEAEFMQKPDTPLPADGESLTGTITKNQFGLQFKKDRPAGFGGGYGGNREESIDRAVAVKSATSIVSARITAGELKGEEAATAALAAMVEDILAIVKGDKADPKPVAEAPTSAKTDDDIPF